jgi:DNA polymerase-3 subunit epsilon
MRFGWLQARRRFLALRHLPEPAGSLVAATLPGKSTPFEDVEFVALDIETTGLDAARADMLSVGWVVISGGRVGMASARSFIVQPSSEVGHSASVHGLTDTIVDAGENWGIVLDRIVKILTGRILVVHHSGLDKALLDRMSVRRYGSPLPVPVVDTMALELRRQRRKHHIESKSSLRLADLRAMYGLPRYTAHDCLVDAIATAELLVAMVAHTKSHALGDLLS